MTKFTPIPNDIIHLNLNERHFHTYCLIVEHCWNPESGSFDWTEPMSMKQYDKLFGKPRTTLIDHFKSLSRAGAIEISKVSSVLTVRPNVSNPTASDGVPSDLTVHRPITINKTLDSEGINDSVQEQYDGVPTPVGAPSLNAEIDEFLRRAGVGNPTRAQLASSGVEMEYVVSWFHLTEMREEPVSHAIAAIRDTIPLPHICDICGNLEGKHSVVKDSEGSIMECPMATHPNMSHTEVVEFFGELEKAGI